MTGPLTGVVVVALEQAVAAPFCTFQLAELGATVYKIERTGSGDVIRGWDDVVRGLSAGFVWVNANKRSVELDLSDPMDRDVLRGLCDRADVVVENFAPGVASRWGAGFDELATTNPSMIYCSITGYGQDGPFRDVKSYDLSLQGETGILLTNGYPGHPAKVGLPITDLIVGSTATTAILSALYERDRTHTGKYLDIAMFDAALPWLGYFPHHAWHSGQEPPLSGMRHQYLCPVGPYLASDDRYVSIVVADDRSWEKFCTVAVRKPAWVQDPRFATVAARRTNRDLVDEMVGDVIAGAPRDEWLERLAEAGIPHGSVRTIAEVLTHPQAIARHMFVETESPVGPLPLVRSPLGDPDGHRRLPALGEHTAQARALVAGTAPAAQHHEPMVPRA